MTISGRSEERITPARGRKIADLRALEDRWLLSRAQCDPSVSASLLPDEFSGATAAGAVQHGETFLKEVESGAHRNDGFSHEDVDIRTYGAIWLSSGCLSVVKDENARRFRYLRVFRLRGADRELLASHATRCPSPALAAEF